MANRVGAALQPPVTASIRKTVGSDIVSAPISTIITYLFALVISFIPDRLLKWWKWCPTSFEELENSEQQILSRLKKPYIGQYVNIGSCWDTNEETNRIWTIVMTPCKPSNHLPLVLVHGFASGVGLWVLNLDVLSSNRPVYAFDLLGFGKSSRPTFSKHGLEAEHQFVYSIEAWREQLGLERFILLGHSMGGFIAASYALQYPKRVAHLILCDPWGFPERPISLSHQFKMPAWVNLVAALFHPFNPLASLRAAGPAGPVILKRIRSDLRRKFSSLIKDEHAISNYLYHCNAQTPSGEAAFKAMSGSHGWAKHPMINRIADLEPNIPITFIYGSRSWVDRNPGIQVKYTRLHSYVDVQVIQGSGHHVYADKATNFNRLVLKICNNVDEQDNIKNTEVEQQSEDFNLL